MSWFKRKKAIEQPVESCDVEEGKKGFFSTHQYDGNTRAASRRLRGALVNKVSELVAMQPKVESATYAMDAENSDNPGLLKSGMLLTQWGISDELFAWYASQAFIGHQACAILAQNWLIDKACTVPARDAVRKWLEITSADGQKLDAEQLKEIERLDKKYRIKKHCHDLVRFGRVFGIRVAMFKVDLGGDPVKEREYYENPFNIDAVKPGTYKGIVQIDPYWCNPVLDSQDGVTPDSLHFYEPTWWTVNGKKVHRSHLVIFINSEVPDVLKPAYMYGGVSVPQKVAERVYAAERCANELPLLATSKRQTVLKTDVERALANFDSFSEAMQQWVTYRDNYQVKVCDKDAEDVAQLDTSLTDLDEVVMTSYQIVAAAANIPATKLLGTTPKGFNATGEYEEASYHEELESIQEHDLSELVNRHHALMCKSEGIDLQLAIEWRPLDSPTAEELATIRKTDAETDAALVNTGAIDAYDVRNRLIQDNQSGYTWLEAIERPDEPDLEPEEPEQPEQSGQDAIEDQGAFFQAFMQGMAVEQEHAHTVDGDQVNVAAIVLDHLKEDPAYYDKLAMVECGDADKWITVHPNGAESTGSHVKIDENGTIKAGMGGKFNGVNIKHARAGEPRKDWSGSGYAGPQAVASVKKENENRREKEKLYDNLHNEGGEGYNPFREKGGPSPPKGMALSEKKDRLKSIMAGTSIDDPRYAELQEQVKDIEKQELSEFLKEWTKEKTASRRLEWNAWVSSFKQKGKKITSSDIAKKEKEQGWRAETLKKAVALHGG